MREYTNDELGKIYGDLPDQGLYDDMRSFITIGREDALREAAGICDRQHDRARTSSAAARADACSVAILAAIPSEPAKVPEVCVWKRHEDHFDGQEVWEPSCPGREHYYFIGAASWYRFAVCPYCGKAISVREG